MENRTWNMANSAPPLPTGNEAFHPIFHLPSSIFHLPSSIFHLPSSIFHLPSSIFHLPFSIFHFPTSPPTMAKYERFEDLPVWQEAARLYNRVLDLLETTALPLSPGFRNQLDRAALSVSNNIAEGF